MTEVSSSPPGAEPARRRRIVLAATAAMFAIVFVARIAIENPHDAIVYLFVIPIGLVALELGAMAGAISAAVAFGLFATWAVAEDAAVSAIGYLVHAAAFFAVGLIVGVVSARRQQARAGSQAAEQRLRSIVETTHEAFISMDSDGRITAWNPAAERTFGWSAPEAIGRTVAEVVVPPELRERHWQGLRTFLDTGEGPVIGRRIELEAVHRDGHRLPVELTISALRDAERWSFHAFLHDITERRLNERYLEMQHGVSRVLAEGPLLETLGSRLLPVLGKGGEWGAGVYWSGQEDGSLSCEALWSPRGSPVSVPIHEGHRCEPAADLPREPIIAVSPEDRELLPTAAEAAAAGLEAALWIPLFGGDEIAGGFELFAEAPERGEGELITAVAAIASQAGGYIERRRAERESERLKDEFFSLISHELRTPLTSIIGYAELLGEVEHERLSDQGRRFLEVIERNARRELRLVQDLLLLVRLEAGRFAIELGRVELDSLIAESIEAVRPGAEAGGLELSVEADGVPAFEGDSHRLGQMLDNLLTNAIKFTPDGGRVAVRARREGDEALIEVSDTGIGIPPDEQEHLFERLFRASTATKLQIPGTGLGLTIVKAVVDAHGGAIAVRSTRGGGTTFAVRLPLRREKHEGTGE